MFVLASFQDNKAFFNETNKVVGQLTLLPKARAALQDTADDRVGVSMSSQPWDVRLSGLRGSPCRRLERAPALAS